MTNGSRTEPLIQGSGSTWWVAGVVLSAILLANTGYVVYVEVATEGSFRITADGVVGSGLLGLGVSHDIFGNQVVEHIDWGLLKPGDIVNVTIFVKNTNLKSVFVDLSTDTWVPEGADTFLSASWDFGEEPLGVGKIRETLLILTVSPDVTDISEFSFDIILSISG